ncbi:MAG: hypothetical protein KatS3mg054_0123 [Chloroflexus sp.]|nr:MAG: hypothetical protein KatS3mg054_0123 [Chloroflexus sp.]
MRDKRLNDFNFGELSSRVSTIEKQILDLEREISQIRELANTHREKVAVIGEQVARWQRVTEQVVARVIVHAIVAATASAIAATAALRFLQGAIQ